MFVGAQKKLPKKERGRKEKGEDYIIFTLLNHLIENHYKKWLKFICILLQVTHEFWFLNFTHGKLGCAGTYNEVAKYSGYLLLTMYVTDELL